MYIHEAIQARTAEHPFITRKKWCGDITPWKYAQVKILPTDSPDCCWIESKASNKGPCRGWQPTAEDLAADDWGIVN